MKWPHQHHQRWLSVAPQDIITTGTRTLARLRELGLKAPTCRHCRRRQCTKMDERKWMKRTEHDLDPNKIQIQCVLRGPPTKSPAATHKSHPDRKVAIGDSALSTERDRLEMIVEWKLDDAGCTCSIETQWKLPGYIAWKQVTQWYFPWWSWCLFDETQSTVNYDRIPNARCLFPASGCQVAITISVVERSNPVTVKAHLCKESGY